MVRIKPEWFPTGTYKKLHPRSAGPFKILKKISSNAYVLDLPPDMNISSTFNVEDLTIYHGHYQDESFAQKAILLPMVPTPQEEMEDVYDDRLVLTKTGGYHTFLIKWKGKPFLMLHGSPPQTFRDSIRICTRGAKLTTRRSRVSPSQGELMQARLMGPI